MTSKHAAWALRTAVRCNLCSSRRHGRPWAQDQVGWISRRGRSMGVHVWQHMLTIAYCLSASGMSRLAGSECGSARGLQLAQEMQFARRIEKIAAGHPNATLLSRSPPIVAFDGILSSAVAQRIVRLTDSSLTYSETQAGVDRSVTSGKSAEEMMRNSKTAWCSVRVRPEVWLQPSHQHHKLAGCGYDPHVIELTARIANLTGQPRETFEDLQVLR